MKTVGKLVYYNHGDLADVLCLDTSEPAPTTIVRGQAHIRVLMSPINPSDVQVVKGLYPLKQKPPAVPGLEGVAEIVQSITGNFEPGDRVLLSNYGWGMWRQEALIHESALVKIPKELPPEIAATLIVNPCTAYLMLRKLTKLDRGEVIIQNAANSAVGITVIQMCRAVGLRTINVIRNRPNLQEVVDKLKRLGADAVITEEQLKEGLPKLKLDLPAPRLALECVGGESALYLASALANGGTMAVYGNLSFKPVQVSPTDLIFRGINVTSFWLTSWMADHPGETTRVINEVVEMYMTKKLEAPTFHKFPLSEWKEAIKTATKGFTDEKVLIQFN